MNKCKFIYPYYDNPTMLKMQVDNWNSYSDELKEHVEIILVDDGSNIPAYDIFKECTLKKRLLRVKKNIPWNQHGARNLGASVVGKEDQWLYMSDMDIILDSATATRLLNKELNVHHYYTFERAFAPDFKDEERKYHCNTFLVRKSAYWEIGGYDEDYCGTYGGDGPFLRQLDAVTPRFHLNDILVIGYKETVVADANTRDWDRYGDYKVAYRKIFDHKRKIRDERSLNPVRFEWEQLI